MVKVIKSSIFLCVLGLLCGLLLGFVNDFTKEKIKENEIAESFSEIVKSGITKESIKKLEVNDKVEGIDNIYRGLSIDGVPCYAFSAFDQNEYSYVKVIVVIEIATEDILNVRVLPGSTTHQYDDKLSSSNFGVAGLLIHDYAEHFQVVTEATSSSISVKKCLEAVRQQIINLGSNVKFKSINQLIPNINIFEYTFEINNEDVALLLKYNEGTATFDYFESIGEVDLTTETIEECVAIANVNKPKNWIKMVSIDAQGTKIIVATDKGLKGEIVAEFRVINNVITSIDIKSSNETYMYGPDYTYEGTVEEFIMENYKLGIKDVVATGATQTSNAINYMISLVEQYIKSTGGK